MDRALEHSRASQIALPTAAKVVAICGWNFRILLVFSGFFGNFMPGFGNVLAGAFDGVAGGQDGRRAAEDDHYNKGHSQIASHK